jgi:hypothetical protein
MTLKEWLPFEFTQSFMSSRAAKHLDAKVLKEHKAGDADWTSWPGREKNVLHWVELEGGRAVGWNENPAIGWSFPLIKYNPPA